MYNKVIISTKAGAKIDRLILNQNKEVGFFGTVSTEGTTIAVTDIIIYKQTVTGVTVNTDPMEIIKFNQEHKDIKKQIRFQGHSHVSMGTNPSGVDWEFYKNHVAPLPQNDFYVFMIFNKRNETNAMIYQKVQDKEMTFYKIPVEWEIDKELAYDNIVEEPIPLPTVTVQKPIKKNCFFKKRNKIKPGYGGPVTSYQADENYIDEMLAKYYGYNTPKRDERLPWWYNRY